MAIFCIINSILFSYIVSFFLYDDTNAFIIHFGFVCFYNTLIGLCNMIPGATFPSIPYYRKSGIKKFFLNQNDFSPYMSAFQYFNYMTDFQNSNKQQPITETSLVYIYLNSIVSFLLLFAIFLTINIILELKLVQKLIYRIFCSKNVSNNENENRFVKLEKEKVNSNRLFTLKIKDLTKIYHNLFSKNSKANDHVYIKILLILA
jgi:hypothetical protein